MYQTTEISRGIQVEGHIIMYTQPYSLVRSAIGETRTGSKESEEDNN